VSQPPRVPVGTQVVLRQRLTGDGTTAGRGATGRVVADDGTRYTVRLGDGRTVTAIRRQLALRKAHQAGLALPGHAGRVGTEDGHRLVREHTIYAAVVGSRAFGLDTDASDTDTRGIFQAPTPAFWSLAKPPPHVDGPAPEWFSWEVERFCELALKANPNCLEVLWSPLPVRITPVGRELLELRGAFVSQLVFQTYSGYVLSQFKKLEADLRQHGAPKWKHVMHLLRLQVAAVGLLRTGRLDIDVGPHRERLLAVRAGQVPWPEVEAWRLALHGELDDALAATVLPAAPDVARVDAWLRAIRAASARQDPPAANLSGAGT
jgi:hypothetical protein